MTEVTLPPLVPEVSPRLKRSLYAAAGVDRRIRPVAGTDRAVIPNVLVDNTVPGLNELLGAELAEFVALRQPELQRQRDSRERELALAAERAKQERIEAARTISLKGKPDPAMAAFLAERDELNGATNFEVRRAMQFDSKHRNALCNLLTSEKKKVLRSRHYPIPKQPVKNRAVSADASPPPGAALQRWYFKIGMLPDDKSADRTVD